MNAEHFIAQKTLRNKGERKKGFRPVINIAIGGIAIGIAVMIISSFIVSGFQKEIRNKVIGFGSHILITSYDANQSFEGTPLSLKQSFYPSIEEVDGIKHIQMFAYKAGIVKANDEMQGVVIKGVGEDFDWSFFEKTLKAGKRFSLKDSTPNDSVLISTYMAKKLKLKLGDKLPTYFIQQPPRVRKFVVSGIYESGMSQFDQVYVVGDIKHVRKLNDWSDSLVSGFEVIIDDYSDLSRLDEFIYENIDQNLNSSPITEKHQDIFGWLDLQDWNVIIIISLMILVSAINMTTALLILILERTQMIGLLKAIGATNMFVRKIFLIKSAYLLIRGMLIGNIVGIGFALLQYQFKLITLPQESYYISHVPIDLNWTYVVAINIGAFLLCMVALIIPSSAISKITPVKAIRFN